MKQSEGTNEDNAVVSASSQGTNTEATPDHLSLMNYVSLDMIQTLLQEEQPSRLHDVNPIWGPNRNIRNETQSEQDFVCQIIEDVVNLVSEDDFLFEDNGEGRETDDGGSRRGLDGGGGSSGGACGGGKVPTRHPQQDFLSPQ